MALIIDTGPLFAAYDRSDDDHLRCRRLFEESTEELLIPAPVVPEFEWVCGSRNVPMGMRFLLDDILAGAYTVVPLTAEDYLRCRELIEKYFDSDIGIVDASVLAVAERLKEPKLATLDYRHFMMVRPMHVKALELLPA